MVLNLCESRGTSVALFLSCIGREGYTHRPVIPPECYIKLGIYQGPGTMDTRVHRTIYLYTCSGALVEGCWAV